MQAIFEPTFVDARTPDFEVDNYLRILVAIAKADRENGPRELAFIKEQARRLGADAELFIQHTDKHFGIEKQKVSRLTALMILRDAIVLASLDRNFSLPERQRVYAYAEKLDVPRKDVDRLEALVADHRVLAERWRQLVAGH
ncbi:hypothetical protein [Desulfatitalea alkaliphila]|uniref:Tellurite resistance protein TerB n=1 Tax=Desulfatitalea alkaliphila TaxID=2929485 RepID=A0AA41R3X2_9BACT|nr:hypothetical protein [Desulfatitalea alkaliphila]MCJ8500560.1 hypothetical protein [Desulfatitalea alkaliphila]